MVMSTNSSASSTSSMVVCLCVPFSGSFLDAHFVVGCDMVSRVILVADMFQVVGQWPM